MKDKKLKQFREKSTMGDYFQGLPNEVLYIKIHAMMDMPVSASLYEKAINDYPQNFPEEVEYRRKWDAIPQEVKDKYSDSTFRLTLTEEQEKEREHLFGKCPHPDIQGCGIIQRVTTYEDRYKDFSENDAWLSKWYKHQHRRDIGLYNELFNPYGLSKTYED